MISHIHIRDFAIIEEISVTLEPGLNILTGETGAGKSIIIEAVNLALGSRADTAFVRSGKEKAIIELILTEPGEPALKLLSENNIPSEDTLLIRRELTSAGKSICRVNNELVSVSFLNKLCKQLVDIHGQYDHQSLLNPQYHLLLLDLFDQENITPVKEKVSALYQKYTQTKNTLAAISRREADAARKKDFMEFELSEIKNAALKIGEDEALSQQILLLQNSEQIYGALNESYELLYEESPSACEALGKSMRLMQGVSGFSKEIATFFDQLSDCYYKLEDITLDMRKYRDTITFSAEELDAAVTRLDDLYSIKRKYGGSIKAALAYSAELLESLSLIDHAAEKKDQLEKNLKLYEEQLTVACSTLSHLRKAAAKTMSEQINEELSALNFKDTVLSFSFSTPEKKDALAFCENGSDTMEFLISTNKGELQKPLAKIASGGEISRIMLAFKRIIGDLDRIPTMIFDEIDSGISGVTASIVGKKLLQIAGNHQIICITHLPQIAAMGEHHYKIQKLTGEEATHTVIIPLSHEERVKEIARLLGGLNVTPTTVKNAQELLTLSRLT